MLLTIYLLINMTTYLFFRFLRDSLHFVEPKKIGVWGWSYGGFLTAMIMANKDSKDLFKCGASVAPVSSWRMYGMFVHELPIL